MLYNILMVSAIHQHESATSIHMSPPSWTSLPLPTPSQPSRLSQSPGLSSLRHTADFHGLSNFTFDKVYVSILLSQLLPPSPSPCVRKSVRYVCVSLAALQIGSSVPFFKIPYVLIMVFVLLFLTFFTLYNRL